MPEQRRSRRFELKLPFELLKSGSKPVSKVGETKNLSSGGVLFTSDASMEIGDPIEYLVTLPTSVKQGVPVRLHCVGKVMRNHENPSVGSSGSCAVAATIERYEFVRSGAR